MKKSFSIEKTVLTQYGLIISLIFTAGLLIYFTDDIYVHLAAFASLIMGAMTIVRFDISHPYFWYSFIFLLYSVSYPIMWIAGSTHDVFVYTKSLMLSQWIAISTLLIMVGPAKVEFERLKCKYRTAANVRQLMIFPIILIIFTLVRVSHGGYAHKNEIYNEGSMLIFIGFRAVLVLLILFAINASRSCLLYKSVDKKMAFIVFFVIFCLVYYSGERDLILRFFVICFFIYYILIKKRKLDKLLIVAGLVFLFLIPIMAEFKYYGLTRERNISESNIIMRLLNSEFQSASKNLQILLLDESVDGIFQGGTLISSITRTFKLDKVLNLEIETGGRWYQSRYFAEKRAGQGFSLVGDGYTNFGYAGIVIVFVFVGIFIRTIYKKSNKSVYHFSYYIVSIPVFMYSIRADLANILSPLIIQNLLIIILTYGISEILSRCNRRQ